MSNINKEGVDKVKEVACEVLLKFRSEQNTDTLVGGNKLLKKEEEFLKGVYVAQPKA